MPKKWNKQSLILTHLTVGLFLWILFSKPMGISFDLFDRAFFRFVNSWVKESFFWQNFWAMANHRGADWVGDVIFILFFAWIIRATPSPLRIQKSAECLFILSYCACIILLINELLFRVLLQIEHPSPTLVTDGFTYLPEKVTWLKVKAKSLRSFPSDHGTTALLVICSFSYLARGLRRIQVVTTLYGTFLALPRLITGAHWATDLLIGSGSIVAISFAWAFYTPLATAWTQRIEKLLLRYIPVRS